MSGAGRGRTGVPSPRALLDVAVAAARVGGGVLVDGLHRPAQVELKNQRTSIVTWADVTAQREILRAIHERFPDHAVLAEEQDHRAVARRGDGGATLTWLVDPLDGTSNYAHGIPFACTSVAVRDREGPVAGAIYEPFRGELFGAVRGGGAWLGDRRLAVSAAGALRQAVVCTGVQTDDQGAVARFGRRMVALTSRCRAVRCLGSPALALAYVAAGRVDGFVERDATFAWDVGAASLMITEAGGRIDDLDGGPVNFGPGLANVVASNGAIHAELAEAVRSAEREG